MECRNNPIANRRLLAAMSLGDAVGEWSSNLWVSFALQLQVILLNMENNGFTSD
jgi:hypothetical protein